MAGLRSKRGAGLAGAEHKQEGRMQVGCRGGRARRCRPQGHGQEVAFYSRGSGSLGANDTIWAGARGGLCKTQVTPCHSSSTPRTNSHLQHHPHDLDPSLPPPSRFSLQRQPSLTSQSVTSWDRSPSSIPYYLCSYNVNWSL